MATGKRVQIQYFAVLREQRGCSHEAIETQAETAEALYRELQERYQFTLLPEHLKVVVNQAFRPWDTPIREEDTVVFIPPVAGG